MKRSQIPFTVKWNKFLDLTHKSAVITVIGFCCLGLVAIGNNIYYIKYVRRPMLEKKIEEHLSKDGKTI